MCNQTGHLSGACPKNENGLYPNGGGCKFCQSKLHLAKDCKPVQQGQENITLGLMDLKQGGDDDDVFVALQKMSQEEQRKRMEKDKLRQAGIPLSKPKPKTKVVSF